jgi:hypothetical protein
LRSEKKDKAVGKIRRVELPSSDKAVCRVSVILRKESSFKSEIS